MSREIKVRVWSNKYNGFINVTTLYTGGDKEWIWGADAMSTAGDEEFFKAENVVIQLATGLKDKNGQEIYEGDIVELKREEKTFVYQISWEPAYACFWLKTKTATMINGHFNHELYDYYEIRVIGNIIRNPELLEKTDSE